MRRRFTDTGARLATEQCFCLLQDATATENQTETSPAALAPEHGRTQPSKEQGAYPCDGARCLQVLGVALHQNARAQLRYGFLVQRRQLLSLVLLGLMGFHMAALMDDITEGLATGMEHGAVGRERLLQAQQTDRMLQRLRVRVRAAEDRVHCFQSQAHALPIDLSCFPGCSG